MSKIVLNSENVATKTSTTLIDNIFNGVKSVAKVASTEDLSTEYYSDKAVGQAVLGIGAFAFFAGDKWGDRVPLLGGHR